MHFPPMAVSRFAVAVAALILVPAYGWAQAGVTPDAGLSSSLPASAEQQKPKPKPKKSSAVKTRDGSRVNAGGRTVTPPAAATGGALREWPFTAGTGVFVPANNDFAFRLLAQLGEGNRLDENVFFSPAGLSLALGMTANGAAGETRAAMAKVLGWGANVTLEQANRDAQALTAKLAKATPRARLAVANAIWAGPGQTFSPEFVRAASRSYDATASTIDLGTGAGVETVNRWVSDMTGGKIKTLLEEGEVGADTPFVLTNAVYFKGKWHEPFSAKATKDGQFTLPNGTKKALPMMSRTGPYPYLRGDGFQAISLPYDDGKFSLYILLPDEGKAIAEFQTGVTLERWNDWLPNMKNTQAAVQLPRFTLSFDAKMNDALKALGMERAFSRKDADFTPLMNAAEQYIGLVKHRTTLAVDEEGTEAAAATAISGVKDFKKTATPVPFIVDRPFLCAIRDNETGAIVFLGRVTDPQP